MPSTHMHLSHHRKSPQSSHIRLQNLTGCVSSRYPVILSLEVHCTLRNQKIIADMFNQIFGKKLYIPPQSQKILPSPEELKHKIVLKVSLKNCFQSFYGNLGCSFIIMSGLENTSKCQRGSLGSWGL